MKTTTRMPKARAKTARPSRTKPLIDYPKQSERIEAPQYTLRISAPGAKSVAVAVDQGQWQECRESVGYWWFDWSPEPAGQHELIACAHYSDGRELVSELVHCFN